MIRLILTMIAIIQYAQFRSFTIRNQRFYDAKGREIIFHGINIVQKNSPYYKQQFGDQQFKRLKQWGLNAIRLGVMWDGVQPQQGKYNDTYLQHMVDFVNKAGKQYGIYTLIQFHQDLFSSLFCSDGVPEWAIKNSSINWNFPYPLQIPQNKTKCQGRAHWQQFYFSYAINEAFYQLYTNVNQLRDRFIGYWKQIANTFKDNPYVIGYQLLNEPWPGNMYRQPTILIPGLSQKAYLQQFYDIISTQIRKIDSEQNICIEPVTWLNAVPSGFEHAPGGQQYANTSMLCFHYYVPTVLNMDMFLYARKLDMTRLKMGGMITQFQGLTQAQLVDPQLFNKCDKLSISWFAWQYRNTLAPFIFKRTYAQRIAGEKQYQHYDNVSKQYKLRYKSNNNKKKIQSQTVIFFNQDHYLYGVQNDTDYQLNLTCKRKIEFDRPINIEQELNMKITIIPQVKYEISENMYIKIKAKDIKDDGRIVIVKIQRKVQYNKKQNVETKTN